MTRNARGFVDEHVLVVLMSGADEMMEVLFIAGTSGAVWIWIWSFDTDAFVVLSAAL